MDEEERHLLGSLLSCEDEVFAPTVGPIAPAFAPPHAAAYWPEPPPPYTPGPNGWVHPSLKNTVSAGGAYGGYGAYGMPTVAMEAPRQRPAHPVDYSWAAGDGFDGGRAPLRHASDSMGTAQRQAYLHGVAYAGQPAMMTAQTGPPAPMQQWMPTARPAAVGSVSADHIDAYPKAEHVLTMTAEGPSAVKSYRDAASNKKPPAGPSSGARPTARRVASAQRQSSSTDSQSDSGSPLVPPTASKSDVTTDSFDATLEQELDGAVEEAATVKRQASGKAARRANSGSAAAGGGEFQKITRRRGAATSQSTPTRQSAPQPQQPTTRFQPLDNHDDSSRDEQRRRRADDASVLMGVEQRGRSKSPQGRRVVRSEEVDEADSQARAGRKGRKGGREASDLERRRRQKKNSFGVVAFLSSMVLVCVNGVRDAAKWLFDLVSDIGAQLLDISLHLWRSATSRVWGGCVRLWYRGVELVRVAYVRLRQRRRFSFPWWRRLQPQCSSFGLDENIVLPASGDEAIDRLLSCSGKDAYCILGVRADCADDEIKRYYKRQAVLVHPDKNSSYGAAEAFKILAHAFELVGATERRARYNVENIHRTKTMREIDELVEKLKQKMEEALSSMPCDCGSKHRRFKTKRSVSDARYCRRCSEFHPARDNDIWAESRWLGFIWHYYACMDGVVYEITEWAGCSKNLLKHMKANSHSVQYRLISAKGEQRGGAQTRPRKPTEAEMEELLSQFFDEQRQNVAADGDAAPSDFAGASYRPPERPGGADSRPRKANRRRRVK